MALLLKFYDSIRIYMDSHGDPRTKEWPMMSSPFPTLAVCLSYVYLVKVLGPRLMENRKPFHLQNFLIVYNFVQVIFSAWLFYECLMGGWWGNYSFRCQPVDHSGSATATRMVHACWWYYFSKFTEFIDTIFFVLRKKTSQVTTLHVIHHGCMPMSVWFGVKFTPGGHSTFFGLLNTFVHIVMYTYYLFSAMGPRYQKYLWWKKYLTSFQMIQFVAIMVHAFQLLFIECNYPRAFVWLIGMHAVMFFFLFNEFYKTTYQANKRRREAARAAKLLAEQEALALANGHCISETQPLTDKSLTNGYCNGTAKLNGAATNGSIANGSANGSVPLTNGSLHSHTNGTANGHVSSTKADILLRGDLPTEITQRKIQK